MGLAVAIQYSGLAGIHFKADFGFCVGHGLGVLGGQSSRIYFDVAVAEVANVEVFAHLRHRFLLVAKGSVSLLKEHCPRFWNTAKPPITDRVLHDPELQGQRVDATFGFYGFVENVHALSVSRS